MNTKKQLKDVFKGVASLLFQTTPIFDESTTEVGTINLAPEYDLPVHVGDLSLVEGDTTVNHYKVLGQDSDWVATATKGDFDISFLVPTLHTLVMQMAYGSENVQTVNASLAADSGAGSAATAWAGIGINLEKHEVRGTIALLNEKKDRMLIIANAVLWASMKFENAETDPYAIQFNGTMEATGGPDVLFLKKSTTSGSGNGQ